MFRFTPFDSVFDNYFDEVDRYMAHRMNMLFNNAGAAIEAPHAQDTGNRTATSQNSHQSDSSNNNNTTSLARRHVGGGPGGIFDVAFPRFSRSLYTGQSPFRMDVSETPKEFVVHAELPGTKKEDIQAQVEDGVLLISAERNHAEEFKDVTKHITERSFGKFQRSIRMPENVDTQSTQAKFENGVLTLKFNKKNPDQEKEVKKISIN